MEPNRARRDRLVLIAGVYLWEASALLIIISLYHMTDELLGLYHMPNRPNPVYLLSSHDVRYFLMATLLFICMGVYVLQKYRALRDDGGRPFDLLLKTNILPVLLAFILAEGTLRLFSVETPRETLVWGRSLRPYHFKGEITRRLQQINETMDYDRLLGWLIRPNLTSKDGMYFTGSQGIRTPRTGKAFIDYGGTCRIALIGDSHTFGSELPFEDTWAYRLERDLPQGCQVLNFGVPGYSLGQMYLRYLRDVRAWHPNVVILSLSSGSAERTIGVYGVTMFPAKIPFAQPRFQLADRELIPINVPLPVPEEIASIESITDLPFIDYDWSFSPGDWELPQWRYLYHSYVFRLLSTWYPARRGDWRVEIAGSSLEPINHELLRSFIHAARSDRANPMVVYLPDKTDYENPVRGETVSLRVLRSSEIDFLDLVPCLEAVPPEKRFIPHGDHYSPAGGGAIAQCLRPVVVRKISISPKGNGVIHKAERG